MINKRTLTIGVTGINSKVDNPGPGLAVARCLLEKGVEEIRVIGLGYDTLDAGMYTRDLCDRSYLMPYPSLGESALLARIEHIHAIEHLDALIPSRSTWSEA